MGGLQTAGQRLQTCCQGIELLRGQSHVVGPRNRETGRAHEVGNTSLGVVVAEPWHIVQAPPRAGGIEGRRGAHGGAQARYP